MDPQEKPVRYRRLCVPDSELEFPGPQSSVSVLKVGYCVPEGAGRFRADGTISLVRGPTTVLVDTGGPWDRGFLLGALEERGLRPQDVQVVVGTHGHSDHVGNLNLFPGALTIVGHDVSEGDTYRASGLSEGHAHFLNDHVSVIPTPGHSGQDVSVRVTGTAAGIVLISGDLFESGSDEDTWRDVSLNPAVQQSSREGALRDADLIIPGHGLPFRVLRD